MQMHSVPPRVRRRRANTTNSFFLESTMGTADLKATLYGVAAVLHLHLVKAARIISERLVSGGSPMHFQFTHLKNISIANAGTVPVEVPKRQRSMQSSTRNLCVREAMIVKRIIWKKESTTAVLTGPKSPGVEKVRRYLRYTKRNASTTLLSTKQLTQIKQ